MSTVTIEVFDEATMRLLRELEALHLLRVVEKFQHPAQGANERLSDKYRGMLTPEQGDSLTEHVNKMREEWNGTS